MSFHESRWTPIDGPCQNYQELLRRALTRVHNHFVSRMQLVYDCIFIVVVIVKNHLALVPKSRPLVPVEPALAVVYSRDVARFIASLLKSPPPPDAGNHLIYHPTTAKLLSVNSTGTTCGHYGSGWLARWLAGLGGVSISQEEGIVRGCVGGVQ